MSILMKNQNKLKMKDERSLRKEKRRISPQRKMMPRAIKRRNRNMKYLRKKRTKISLKRIMERWKWKLKMKR